jgi:flagellar M-ring protein FliF
MPQESLFTEQEHEAKAAVILKTRSGKALGTSPAGDSATGGERGRPAASGKRDGGRCGQQHAAAARARRDGCTYAPDEELAKTLVHTLEPVVGADHVRASVHVEYDLGTSEETQETYDPKTPTALTQEHSEESSTGEAPAGVPGTASNVPTGTPPPAQPALRRVPNASRLR